jgi:hypothetical protein
MITATNPNKLIAANPAGIREEVKESASNLPNG